MIDMVILIAAIVFALVFFSILKELAPFALLLLGIGWVLMKLHGA